MSSSLEPGASLRQRKPQQPSSTPSATSAPSPVEQTKPRDEEVVWGKTPGGEVFRVPTTHDVLTTLLHPGYPKSHLDLLNLALLASQILLFFLLPRRAAQVFFALYFAFWRAAYDAGLGWVLTKQSKRRWIVKEVHRRGWLDEKKRPKVRNWIKKQLADKMGQDYSFDELPLEYNTWLLFRQLVDVILVNDFLSYCMFAFSCFRVPSDLSMTVHVIRWLAGLIFIGFNLWVKTEAHNVVKDYGWYWGDCFFQRGALVFDGVFELAPHPMYSVGYAGYYGLSLIIGSYAVLFVSLAAHAAQFAFLVFFENPHIERFYGQRKALAKRTPIVNVSKSSSACTATGATATATTGAKSSTTATTTTTNGVPTVNGSNVTDIEDTFHHKLASVTSTPAATEGDTATETEELETETETEIEDEHEHDSDHHIHGRHGGGGVTAKPSLSDFGLGGKKKRGHGHHHQLSVDSIASANGDVEDNLNEREGEVGVGVASSSKVKLGSSSSGSGSTATTPRIPSALPPGLVSGSGMGRPASGSVSSSAGSVGTPAVVVGAGTAQKRKLTSQHDLLNKYFRRDAVVLKNVDLLRATDAMLVLILVYTLSYSLLPSTFLSSPSSTTTTLTLHFIHALLWVSIHYFGLGLLLRAQSQNKFLVRHYIKNYHYDDGGQGAIIEAFGNWKVIYNLSMCMTYVSCLGLVWKAYLLPTEWTVGDELLRHVIGILLIGLNVWATLESYEVLGIFGWFFGDFFMEEFPSHLEYTGIYRYLNNPEAMGSAAWFGLALLSGSKLVFALAAFRHLANWWFLSYVEHPHMRKLYGDSLRKDAGFVKVMKSVASKNAKLLESRAERHAPELRRVARQVVGTFDKVYEEAAEAVEEFLARSAPRISEVVQETQVLLQQSRERLIISRVSKDLSSYDTTKYRVSVVPNPVTKKLSFHLGESIVVKWQAPHKHSRKDWIGLYRVGANKSKQVTKTSCFGLWLPVYNEEWDGDVPLGMKRSSSPHRDAEKGTITFKGNTLPWIAGKYEVRYHHDGKYNVMSMDGPIEIYVDRPAEMDFKSVRETLAHVVPLALDSDPALIPLSCKSSSSSHHSGKNASSSSSTSGVPPDDTAAATTTASSSSAATNADTDTDINDDTTDARTTTTTSAAKVDPEVDHEDRDPDDFSFWSEKQAKRISAAIKQIFDVEYAPEVVLADANLTALANRILVSRELLSTGP